MSSRVPVASAVILTILDVLDQLFFKELLSHLLVKADSYRIGDILAAKFLADPHSGSHRTYHYATLLTLLHMLLDFHTARLLNLPIEEFTDLA